MIYIQCPLSLRIVKDLVHEQGIEISHRTVRYLRNKSGPIVDDEIRRQSVEAMRASGHWQWHVGGVYVKING